MITHTTKKPSGLHLRNGIWHIDKAIYGRRICESTRTTDIREAEELLAYRVAHARRAHLFGPTFREAAAKFLAENLHMRALERYQRSLTVLDPFIGSLPLQHVHHDTLAPFIQAQVDRGLSPATINRDLAAVRRILRLASLVWRDETGHPWLPLAPLIPLRAHHHPRAPYPLSVTEQRLLFSELDAHLKSMALFKVNTGLREKEVVNLRWEWEAQVPELDTSVFIVPRDYVKNALDRYVVLNQVARSVIESCRGRHSEFVFTRNGARLTKIYNSGWKAARRRAAARYERELGRPCPAAFRSIRVHDLKHTYGHRLRGAGVSLEDRQFLLGHKPPQAMTTYYSAADVSTLIEASEKICQLESRASAAISVVRLRAGPLAPTAAL